MRVIIDKDPYAGGGGARPWYAVGEWPCSWVCCPDAGEPPFVTAYRRRFTLERDAVVRVHVSADERYELFLDGERIGRGSERGAPHRWFYETYDLPLARGDHTLVARVWSLGPRAAFAQMSVHPGFILGAEGEYLELLGTGVADWQAKRLEGYSFLRPERAHWKGDTVAVDGSAFAWGFERGEGDGWREAETLGPGLGALTGWEFPPLLRLLCPATLPPMLEREWAVGTVRLVTEASVEDPRAIPVRGRDHLAPEERSWQELVRGSGSVEVPPHTSRRVIVDLEDYVCAYPEIATTGGAGSSVRVLWAEALYDEPAGRTKGHRGEIEGKYFIGIGDTFLPDGGRSRRFETLWWECGRYVEILVRTAERPLTIERFALRETRYPLEMESGFEASDPRLSRILPILVRGMQMCAHETYFDCPYYEELMYAGDTRLEMLTTYVMTRDDRLPRKALEMFDTSRLASGLTQARYPSRVPQVIAPFSLWWVAMVCDYALWRDDLPLVERLMPGVRATVGAFERFLGAEDGLLHSPEGWNTFDWVPSWEAGIPPGGKLGDISGPLNWQLVWALSGLADLEAALGEHELAARARRRASELAGRVSAAFWDEGRGLYADDLARRRFSEHSQCLAILSGQLDFARRARVAEGLLRGDDDLARATIYFSHYLFEAYRELGRIDALLDRLELWFDLERQGFKTPVEMPEPSRSDCHAWGAHPLYHLFASILGIRPAGLGFRTVQIAPQLGPLTSARGAMVHPRGEITVELRVEDGDLRGEVCLPEGVEGTLTHAGVTRALAPGRQAI
jgi:hypothetical protein